MPGSRSGPTPSYCFKLLVNTNGKKVRLTEKETAVLRHLYRAGQRPVSREQLLHEVWGYEFEYQHPHSGDSRLSPAAES